MNSNKSNHSKIVSNDKVKKTNILITTFNKAHNYGAMLQEYALMSVLEAKGYNVNILNYNDKEISKNYKYYGFGSGNIVQRIRTIVKYALFFKKNKKRYLNFKEFETKNINLTKEYCNVDSMKNIDTDVLITGSDQVWNFQITNGLSDVYTLNFGKNKIKRISYAASIGVKHIPEDLKDVYREKISKVDRISVREESGKITLSPLFKNKKISVVLDPTLIAQMKIWNGIIDSSDNTLPKERYILAYVIEKNDDFYNIANYLSQVTGLKIVHFERFGKKYKNVLENKYTSGPDEFVSLIKNADYILATSFHATVFSIIFNKKFWVVPHKTTGSRVTDLLKKLNISDRAVNSFEEFKKHDFDENINYQNVNKILEREREKSIKWLINAIDE